MSALSKRVQNLSESSTLRMARIARELKEKGLDIISLSLGEPDFNAPTFIKEAAKKAIDENYSKYSPVPGFKELQLAICEKLKRDNGLNYAPSEIVVSTGAKQAIMNIILSLVNPGDEVILPAPFWVSYTEMVKFAEGNPVVIPTDVFENFKITKEKLEKAITSKTKLFIFSNPCNPSGSVYSKSELEALVSVFEKHKDIYVISDEIYELINFVGSHTSLASFSSIKERVVTINGVSKGFAMTGYRLGYSASNQEIASAASKIQGQFTSGTSSISQMAALAAMKESPSVTFDMKKQFEVRKNLLVNRLSKLPGIKVNNPEGAFYIFPDVSSFFGKSYKGNVIDGADKFSELLLEHGHVATISGASFGSPNNIRLSYATSEKDLNTACDRIEKFLKEIA